jgi:nucleoside-diphosphate-sugar epimerase
MAHSEWEDAVRPRRIVATGGAGFIGSHLVRALLAAGAAHVRVIDDLRSGFPEPGRPRHVYRVLESANGGSAAIFP